MQPPCPSCQLTSAPRCQPAPDVASSPACPWASRPAGSPAFQPAPSSSTAPRPSEQTSCPPPADRCGCCCPCPRPCWDPPLHLAQACQLRAWPRRAQGCRELGGMAVMGTGVRPGVESTRPRGVRPLGVWGLQTPRACRGRCPPCGPSAVPSPCGSVSVFSGAGTCSHPHPSLRSSSWLHAREPPSAGVWPLLARPPCEPVSSRCCLDVALSWSPCVHFLHSGASS